MAHMRLDEELVELSSTPAIQFRKRRIKCCTTMYRCWNTKRSRGIEVWVCQHREWVSKKRRV